MYVGGYEINATSVALSDNYPHWVKPAADEEAALFLYFDGFFGWWQVGYTLRVEEGALLMCYDEQDYSPVACRTWYDLDLAALDNLYLYECAEEDMLRSVGGADSHTQGVVVAVVLCALLYLGCCLAPCCCLYCICKQKGRAQAGSGDAALSDVDAGVVEMETQTSPLSTNAAPMQADFSPLNVEDTPVNSSTANGTSPREEDVLCKSEQDVIVPNDEEEEEEETEVEAGNVSQTEDDDEKKDESERGIYSRRMSQQMIKAMAETIDEWTDALIHDPKEAARRYSRTEQPDKGPVAGLDPLDPLSVMQDALNLQSVDEDKKGGDDEEAASLDPLYSQDNQTETETETDNASVDKEAAANV